MEKLGDSDYNNAFQRKLDICGVGPAPSELTYNWMESLKLVGT